MAAKKRGNSKKTNSKRTSNNSRSNKTTTPQPNIYGPVKELEKGSINPRKLGSIIENKINPDEFYVLQNGVKLPFVKNTKDYQLFLTGYYDVSLNGIGNKGKKFDNIPRDYQFWYLDRVNSCYDMVNTFKVIRLIKKNGEKLTDKEIASMMLDYGIAFYDGKNKLERFINLIIVNLDNKSLYNILNKIAHYDLTEVESHYKISHTDLMSIFDTWNIEVPKKSVFAGSMSSKLIDKLEQEVFDQFNNTDYLYLKTKLLFNGTKFNKEHFYKYMKGVFANKGYKLLYFNDNTLFPFTKNYNTSSSSVIFTCSETNSNFEIIPWDDFVRKSEEERKVILTKFIDYKVAHKQNLDSFTELQKYLSLNMLTKYNWVRLFTIHGIKVPNIFRGKQLDKMYQQSSLKEMRDNLLSIVKNEHCNDYGFVISTFENCYCSYLAMECSPGLSTYRVETFSDFIRFISKDKKRYIFNNRTKNKRTVDATLLSNPANSDDKNINGITHIDLDTKEIYDEKVHKNKLLKVIINYVNDHPKEQTVRLETITELLNLSIDDVPSKIDVLNQINDFKTQGDFQKNGFNLNKIKSVRKHEWVIERFSNFNTKTESKTVETTKDIKDNKSEDKNSENDQSTVTPIKTTKEINKFDLRFDTATIKFKYGSRNQIEDVLRYIRSQLNANLSYSDYCDIEIKITNIREED